jgi:hypothetical protein
MRREESEKISLRFPQTFEATALVSIYINCKEFRGLVGAGKETFRWRVCAFCGSPRRGLFLRPKNRFVRPK